MKVLLDTNVLVAALVANHPHYPAAEPWLTRAQEGKLDLVLSIHNLAELYTALTRLPEPFRVPPLAAWQLMCGEVLPFAQTVALTQTDYVEVVGRMAERALLGSVLYDALIVRAAEKANVARLVTLNIPHFRRVWPEGEGRIVAP